MEHNQGLIDELKKHIEKILVDKDPKSESDPDDIKRKIRDDVGAFLFTKTQRRPMILPVIIEL